MAAEVERLLVSPTQRMITAEVERLHAALFWRSPEYRRYVEARRAGTTIEGREFFDTHEASTMLKAFAAEQDSFVQYEKQWPMIAKAWRSVMRKGTSP